MKLFLWDSTQRHPYFTDYLSVVWHSRCDLFYHGLGLLCFVSAFWTLYCCRACLSAIPSQAKSPGVSWIVQLLGFNVQFCCYLFFPHVVPDCHAYSCVHCWWVVFLRPNFRSWHLQGLHLLPNSISMSIGSLFAGWMIHYTGNYKIINMIFGVFPFIGATLITQISESSGLIQSWFSIVRCLVPFFSRELLTQWT